jgi:hypothetical protein
MSMKNKKSQMEMMGIAIVVILISLGLVFVIRFMMLREPTQHGKEFAQSELAANFLNTFLDTTAPPCSNLPFSTLLRDCADYRPEGSISCSGFYSCEYIRNVLVDLLDDTFGQWHIDYYFVVSDDLENPQEPLSQLFAPIGDWEKCSGDRKMKQQPLPADIPIYLMLYICE